MLLISRDSEHLWSVAMMLSLSCDQARMPVVSSKKIAQCWSQASIHHLKVRILPPQPGILVFGEFSFLDEKGPPNAGFSHRR